MALKKLSLFFLLHFLGFIAGIAINLPEMGVPLLRNFSQLQYQNKGKVWDITTTPNGIIYCAADGGLLEYDGKTWNSFRGSNGITRSVLAVNDSLIFTGSDLDFGVWRRNQFLGFDYTSLYPFQKQGQFISEEFWQIHRLHEVILFVSSQSIYVYKDREVVKIDSPGSFNGSYQVGEAIYFADKNNRLLVLEDFSLKAFSDLPGLENTVITGVTSTNNGLLIATRDLGLFLLNSGKLSPFKNEISGRLKTTKTFSFERIGNGHMAFGTVLGGLYVTNTKGDIIHQINRQKGLPGNTVLSMHFPGEGKLWLGMDYGISSIDLKNNFTTLYDFRGDFGTGYTAIIKDDVFYLGTNQGLYHSPWQNLRNNREMFSFELIPGTEGQVWTLKNINNTLLMGHDKGLFSIIGSNVEKIGGEEGIWSITPYRDILLTGSYNGISIFKKSGNIWSFARKMDLILGSCNQLIIENGDVLWVNIPNFGIIRAQLNKELQPVERLIFTSDIFEGYHVALVQKETGIYVLTDSYHYVYNSEENRFTRLIDQILIPGVYGQLAGYYMPVPLNDHYEFYPIYNGFALRYNAVVTEVGQDNFSLALRKIVAFNSHERMLAYSGKKIPFYLRNIHVECIVPNMDNILYQYKLNTRGIWTDLTPENTIDLLDLRKGDYQLFVRAVFNNSIVDEKKLAFRIAPPWYLTWYAYAAYIVVFGLIISGIYTWRSVSLKKQKKIMLLREKTLLRQQTEKHKEEIMIIEQKRLQAEYDQLKKQLKSKTIELANKARDNEEKNRLLLTLKEKCEIAQENPALLKIKWGEMQRLLDSYLKNEDKTFEIQMDELHQEFFTKLRQRCPDLSHNDLRMCAYLKIGLNSKEIAELINIQPSSFYISRSRLRKKLNLKTEEDLYGFLNRI